LPSAVTARREPHEPPPHETIRSPTDRTRRDTRPGSGGSYRSWCFQPRPSMQFQ
jgi:hypothetical protein